MLAIKAGLSLGMSLIIALGPQNMFIIRQGIKREYIFLTALVCVLCDAFMMMTSTSSLSHLIIQLPLVKAILLILGVMFLAYYGLSSLLAAYKLIRSDDSFSLNRVQYRRTMVGTIIAAMSFSLLNPHAVIECVIMIGGIAIQYPAEEQYWFVFGAIIACVLWFYALAYGSAVFAKLFENKWFWCALECASGIIMLIVAWRFMWTF